MALKRFLRWLADGPKPAEDALVVVIPDADAGRAAAPLLRRLADGSQRLSVIAAVAARSAAPQVSGVEPRRPQLVPGIPVRAVLSGLRARSVVVVGGAALTPGLARLLRGARRRGLPVYRLEPGTWRVEGLSRTAREAMPPGGAALAALATHLARSIGVERGEGAVIDAAAGAVQRALARPAIRRAASLRLRRIDDVEALTRRLGRPGTILCLGNGPSSEHPVLAALAHDTLFRVNHQWMTRGFLDRPDMIFAGVKRSMRAARRIPIGVATPRKERALLAARALEFWHGPAEWCVVEDIAARLLPPVTGPLRPTTGAYMIAAAVALAPGRLVVAGMDLFSHPGGAYPGGGAVNAYTPSHDVETDAAFIRACLGAFEGELVTLSPAFAALAREVPGARFALDALSP